MQRLVGILAIMLILMTSSFARAQNAPQAGEYLLGRFLMSHSGVASDLQNNPSLYNNLGYLQQHPELQNFLNNNPQVTQMLTDPNFRASELSQQNWRGLFENSTGESPGAAAGQLLDRFLGTANNNNQPY
ncbi:MAG: hypothetical protein IVW54_10530 [Candidatus Binataceae bacterium]|nr:hypothetical protein [Candidatus Binataceae bacterium]